MKTFDAAAIGELNADLILNRIGGHPEVGKEIFAEDMLLTLGSSTAIFAANIASLGARTAFVGMIGRDLLGSLVCTELERKRVDTSCLVRSGEHSTGVTVVMNYGEDRANVTYAGAMNYMRFADIDPTLFDRTRHIHLSSLFMQRGLLEDIGLVLERAREKGVTVSLDLQWDPAEQWNFDYRRWLPLVDLFLPNEKELMALTRRSTPEAAVEEVRPYLGRALVLKCGSRGSLLVPREGEGEMRRLDACLNRSVVDAIGAGDSFNAGFVYAFVQGRPLEACQELGNLTGAVNTTAAGGTGAFTDRAEVIRRAREYFNREMEL